MYSLKSHPFIIVANVAPSGFIPFQQCLCGMLVPASAINQPDKDSFLLWVFMVCQSLSAFPFTAEEATLFI